MRDWLVSELGDTGSVERWYMVIVRLLQARAPSLGSAVENQSRYRARKSNTNVGP